MACTGAYFDYQTPISTAVGSFTHLLPVPAQAPSSDRQRAHQGSPEHQYAPRYVAGYRRNVSLSFPRDSPRHGSIVLTLVIALPSRYNFRSDPRDVGAVVILSADESTYTGQTVPLFCMKIKLKVGYRSWTAQVRPWRAPSDRCAGSSCGGYTGPLAYECRIAWYQDRGAGVQSIGIAGRSFYTSLGHLNETWQV